MRSSRNGPSLRLLVADASLFQNQVVPALVCSTSNEMKRRKLDCRTVDARLIKLKLLGVALVAQDVKASVALGVSFSRLTVKCLSESGEGFPEPERLV